jgi:hypothetical protein
VTGLEAMHDAIMTEEGWYRGSRSQVNRNPGNLRGSRSVPHTMDADGYAAFPSIVDGSTALLDLLRDYGNGYIVSGITWDSTLDELFSHYAPQADHNQPNVYALSVAAFVSRCLGRAFSHQSSLRDICGESIAGGTPA